MVWLELGVIVVLVLLNGVLAMSELAVVSARRPRLEALLSAGRRGARAALQLADQPGRFLSTVQIGITLVGIAAGTFGGATLARDLALYLDRLSWVAPHGEAVAFVLVVLGTTYATLILGELVPKQLALRAPERVAARVAPGMRLLSRLAGPAVSVLDGSTSLVLRLLGAERPVRPEVTEEEVRAVITEGGRSGALHADERELLRGVMRVADWTVEAVATPRREVVWLDVDADEAGLREVLAQAAHSRLVVARGSLDAVLGVVKVEALMARALAGEALAPGTLMQPAAVVHRSTPALKALGVLHASHSHVALVVDGGGALLGILTAMDVLTAMSRGLTAPGFGERPPVRPQPDGSWEADADAPLERVADAVGLPLPGARQDFHTLAGLVLWQLERVPEPGESVRYAGFRLEVLAMEGPRVRTVGIRRLDETPSTAPPPG